MRDPLPPESEKNLVKNWPFSERTAASLRSAGITTAEQAAQYCENDYINQMYGFWGDQLNEVKEFLYFNDLKLKNPGPCSDQIHLTLKQLKQLDDYSRSLPSGTYIGKRWRRRVYNGEAECWVMGEYYDCGSNKEVGINWRPIAVIEALAIQLLFEKVFPILWA